MRARFVTVVLVAAWLAGGCEESFVSLGDGDACEPEACAASCVDAALGPGVCLDELCVCGCACATDDDCDDGDPCTEDRCDVSVHFGDHDGPDVCWHWPVAGCEGP